MHIRFAVPLNNLDYTSRIQKPGALAGHKRLQSPSLAINSSLPAIANSYKEFPCNVNRIDVGGQTRVIVPKFNENPSTQKRKTYCEISNAIREEIIQHDTQQPSLNKSELTASLKMYSPHEVPDVSDPYFYCRVCDRTYRNKTSFRTHLQKFHDMQPPPLTSCPPELQPDPKDPNFYCKVCRRKYRGKKNFRFHLQYIHFMKLEDSHMPKVYPDMVVDVNDPYNTCCIYCKTQYSDGDHYRRHMKKVHKNGRTKPVKGKPQVNPHIIPDLYDPNFYCKSCKVTMRKRHAYRYHLFSIHDIETFD